MSTEIGETTDGQYILTQYSAGKDKGLRIQVTDKNITTYNDVGYIHAIDKIQAREMALLLLKWSES